jgi:hypothetical protein
VSIGEVLAHARDQAGLSIAQVSEQTRIRQGIIQGIEADDYGVCGGDFYVRGHIRSIAQAVGTDPGPLIEEYDQDFSATGPISATGIEELVAMSRPPQRPRLNPAVLIAAAVVVVLGVGGYLLASGLGHGSGAAPRAAAPSSQAGASPAAAQASKAVVVRLTSPHGTAVVFTTLSGRYLSRSYAAAGTAVTYTLHRAVHIKLSDPAGVRLTVNGKNPLPAHSAAGPVTLSLGPGRPVTVATPAAAASPAPSPSPTSSVQNLQPVSATAFGAFGRPGDNPQDAQLAIDGSPGTGWHTDWYTTPRFGNLYPGTGLLLNMGHQVTVDRVRVRLGPMPGAHFQIRVGSARDLAGLPVAAHSAGPGGVIRLPLASPAHGRYVLVWFTQLPRDAAGTFQVSVFNVAVRGQG